MIKYDIWLSRVIGVSPPNGKIIANSGLDLAQIYENRYNLEKYGIFTDRQINRAKELTPAYMADIRKIHREKEIKSVNCFDEDYPYRLKDIFNLPVVLFYKGDLSLRDSRYTLSVIGSRHCSGEGEKAAGLIASQTAAAGAVIVSGLAQGIDTASHKQRVQTGGKTIAVTGVPLDEYYPKTNRKFQKQLEKEHLVVSEYHSNYGYHAANFVHRNRIIAALGDRLCVVQAKNKSGSLATVNDAVEYSKPVFTIPGSIFDPAYEGSNDLLVKNIAMAVTDGNTIMEYLGFGEENFRKTKQTLPDISEGARHVLEYINGAVFPATIIKESGLSAGDVKAALTELEICGYTEKTSTGEYIRCN